MEFVNSLKNIFVDFALEGVDLLKIYKIARSHGATDERQLLESLVLELISFHRTAVRSVFH